MTKSEFFLACCLSSVVGVLSCGKSNDNPCSISYSNAPVTKVQGPSSGLVNQDLALSVLFTCFNSCGRFGRIEENSNADTTTIKVIARYEGCVCADVLSGGQAIYKFRATRAGTYHLKFWQGKNSYLTDTITIR